MNEVACRPFSPVVFAVSVVFNELGVCHLIPTDSDGLDVEPRSSWLRIELKRRDSGMASTEQQRCN